VREEIVGVWLRRLVWIGGGAAALSVIVIGGFFLYFVYVMSDCGYELKSQEVSPDGRSKAGVVEVNCGATTGWATWVVLADSRRPFRYRQDMLAAVKGQELGIRWDGPVLHVSYPASERLNIKRPKPTVEYDPT
jgi:hypothetical protein